MPRRFSSLFRQRLDHLTRAWVDEVYADRRTDLATLLTFRELVGHIPDLFDELAYLLDGLAATRRIRSQEGPRKIPIIAVSAHDSADFHAEALAAGCNEYVTKPIDFDQLVELLDRLTAK